MKLTLCVLVCLFFWAIVHGGTRYDKKESTIQKDSASKSEF